MATPELLRIVAPTFGGIVFFILRLTTILTLLVVFFAVVVISAFSEAPIQIPFLIALAALVFIAGLIGKSGVLSFGEERALSAWISKRAFVLGVLIVLLTRVLAVAIAVHDVVAE